MKRFIVFALIAALFTGIAFADDSAVKLYYSKAETTGILSVKYSTGELNDNTAVFEDTTAYDLESDTETAYPFVISWTGNMTTGDDYTVTFSTDGWTHSTDSTASAIPVSLNVAAKADQNPNLDGNQVYASAANDVVTVNIPALTNTDGRLALQIAEFRPTWNAQQNLTAGVWVCTVNVNVAAN